MAKKIDYRLKAEILREGRMFQDYKSCSKSFYFHYNKPEELSKRKVLSLPTAIKIAEEYAERDLKKWQECERISNAHRSRVCRLRKRTEDMVLNSDCIFLTLTFNDKALQRRNADSRKQAVKRYLNDLNVPYVANIDFGKKNHREHYHALVGSDKIDYSLWHKFGAIKGKKVRNNITDNDKIVKYIAKLTNHAIKETTKRNAIIYSRKKYVCIDRKYYLTDKDGNVLNYE